MKFILKKTHQIVRSQYESLINPPHVNFFYEIIKKMLIYINTIEFHTKMMMITDMCDTT